MYKCCIKRLIDFMLSLIAVIVLFIPMVLIALIIKFTSKGPVLFKQERIGKNKKHFTIYKFRTMYIDTPSDAPTHTLKDPDACITKVGKILRKTSLDELPQIINILKGEMSIVGPRPALWNQEDLIEERDKYKANDVRPGLTGLAQVSGRDELEIPVKAKVDGDYINRITFIHDVQIFLRTFTSVFKAHGVVEGEQQCEES